MDSMQVESQDTSQINHFVCLNYEKALNQSLQAVIDSFQNPNFENFSQFTLNFRELVQLKIDPPLEAIWVYSALAFCSSNSPNNEPFSKLSAVKDLFQLVVSCSASCNSLKSILLIAPVIYNLHKLILDLKSFEFSSKKEKKLLREIKGLTDSILEYTNVCSEGFYDNLDDLNNLIRPLRDIVNLWVRDEKLLTGTDNERLKLFFPLLGEDLVQKITVAECGVCELAGYVIAEAFLLKLSLAFRGQSSGMELHNQLRNWAVGSITGLSNSYFFDSIVRMLLDPTLPVTSLLIPEDERSLRNVLYDSVILVEYQFLKPERLAHLSANHVKSVSMGRLVVTHEAIELLRQRGDQTKALSCTNAFSSSSLPSHLIKLVRSEIGGEFDSNGPNGSSPKAFIRWILSIENRGIKIFDDDMLKYRAKLLADNLEEDLKHVGSKEDKSGTDMDLLFYIDNKGQQEDENEKDETKDEAMSVAFVAAAHSLQSVEHAGGQKRKAESKERKKQPKLFKYNLYEDSGLSGEKSDLIGNEDSSSESEVENPSSSDEE